MPDSELPDTSGLEAIFDFDARSVLRRTRVWEIYETAKPHKGLTRHRFYRDLRDRGFREIRRNGVVHVRGIRGPAVERGDRIVPEPLLAKISHARLVADRHRDSESPTENDVRFRTLLCEIPELSTTTPVLDAD